MFRKIDNVEGRLGGVKPRVSVNCAMSVDGKIATYERSQVRISDEEDMKRVHLMRNESDAVLVGIGTVLADDPSLLVKEKYLDGEELRQPARVVVDPRGRTPRYALVLDGTARTFIVTSAPAEFPNAENIDFGGGEICLAVLMERLSKLGIESVMVEGGGETIWHFFREGLVDGFTVFVGSVVIGGGDSPTPVDGKGFPIDGTVKLTLKKAIKTGGGIILEYNVD